MTDILQLLNKTTLTELINKLTSNLLVMHFLMVVYVH